MKQLPIPYLQKHNIFIVSKFGSVSVLVLLLANFQVKQALEGVRDEWTMRREWLSQVREWHAFQREAKQTLAAISARQATLRCAQARFFLSWRKREANVEKS